MDWRTQHAAEVAENNCTPDEITLFRFYWTQVARTHWLYTLNGDTAHAIDEGYAKALDDYRPTPLRKSTGDISIGEFVAAGHPVCEGCGVLLCSYTRLSRGVCVACEGMGSSQAA